MNLLTMFMKSTREEGLVFACLRIIKFSSLELARFFHSIPCIIISLSSEKVVKKINTYKMNLYLGDKGIARELFVYGKRECISTDLMQNGDLVRPGDVVLDIGANIGYYALMESALVGDEGKVYAIEPSPANYKILQENIKLNGYENVESFNLAMGDYQGKAEMLISDHSNWSRLIPSNLRDHIDNVTMVEVSTVDKFLENRLCPTLVRMDVEGYEINIFRGMKDTLKNNNLSIFIEFHPQLMSMQENMEFFEILEENGFEVRYCLLNPSLVQNFPARYAYKKLGEYGDYAGKFYQMSLAEAKEWVRTHKFMRMPHFLFQKGNK